MFHEANWQELIDLINEKSEFREIYYEHEICDAVVFLLSELKEAKKQLIISKDSLASGLFLGDIWHKADDIVNAG